MNPREHESHPAEPPQNTPRNRLRRRILFVVILVAAGAASSFFAFTMLTDVERLRRFAEAYIRDVLPADTSIGAVSLSIFEGIRLKDVSMRSGDDETAIPLFTCREIQLRHRPVYLLLGQVRIAEIVASEPRLHAVFDDRTCRFNLQDAFGVGGESSFTWPETLPDVRVRDARLLVSRRMASSIAPVGEWWMNLTADGDSDGRVSDVSWSVRFPYSSSGQARLDLADGVLERIDGGIPWLPIELIEMIAEAADPGRRSWLEPLGGRGDVRVVDFTLPLRGGIQSDHGVAIELRGFHFSIPVTDGEGGLPVQERYARLDDAAGLLELRGDGAALKLNGRLHGSPCDISLEMQGALGGADSWGTMGYRLLFEVRDWRIPRDDPAVAPVEARFVRRWSQLKTFYATYEPEGVVDATVEIAREPGPGHKASLRRAYVSLRDIAASHSAFRYRGSGVTGFLEIKSDGSCVFCLEGDRGVGTAVIEGWLSGLGRECAVQLTVMGQNVPLDDKLCNALNDPYRTIWQYLNLDGNVDVAVLMARGLGSDGIPVPWTTWTQVGLNQAEVCYTGFPYPLDHVTGNLSVGGGVIAATDLRGRRGDVPVNVEAIARTGAGRLAELALQIRATQVPLDDTLLNSLDPDPRERVEALSPSGVCDIAANINYAADEPIDYDIAVALEGVDACSDQLPIPIKRLFGVVDVSPGNVGFSRLSGLLGSGRIDLAGQVDRTQDPPPYRVNMHGLGIVFDQSVRGGLPPAMLSAMEGWSVVGPMDVTAVADTFGRPPDEPRWTTNVALAGTTIMHASFPLPVHVSAGELAFDEEAVRLIGIRGECEGAMVTADGTITFGTTSPTLDIRYEISNMTFTDALREAVPWRIRRRWNDLSPTGTVDVRAGRLHRHVDPRDGTPVWNVDAEVVVHDAGCDVGTVVRDTSASMSLQGVARGPLSTVELSGRLNVARVQIGEWHLQDLSAAIHTEGGNVRWILEDIRASLYGGALTGELLVETIDHETRYNLTGSVQRMGLSGFLNAMRREANAPSLNLEGEVGGRFFLSGVAGDRSERRGGGHLSISDAQLYRLPVLLSVLHVINLSVPQESAFQGAEADFFLVADELEFKDIVLQGSALALVGSGGWSLSTRALDLTFVAVSPHRWAQVPVVTELLEGASRELVEVVVTGTPEEPVARARALRGLGNAIDTIVVPKQRPPAAVDQR